jgi:hypothetical protein
MKRLHDVAVRMRPRVPRSLDGAPQSGPDTGQPSDRDDEARASGTPKTGFAKPGEGPRIPARSPFMPSSRDLARAAAQAADEEDNASDAETPETGTGAQDEADDPSGVATPGSEMKNTTTKPDRPISVPRRQIWDLEPDELDEVASHAVVTDRTYLPDAGEDDEAGDAPLAAEADADEDAVSPEAEPNPDDMASRALRALKQAEEQLEARGIPASALYEGEGAKTRVLGFHARDLETDAISAVARKSAGDVRFPAGWIVVVEGPGRGAYFAVTNSVSSIGRGLDQSICLNFGDATISRNNHAAIAYDAEQNRFFLGHGNKSNIVRRNGMPVLSTEELMDGDSIRIGKTTLRFVALCGPGFTWGPDPAGGQHECRLNVSNLITTSPRRSRRVGETARRTPSPCPVRKARISALRLCPTGWAATPRATWPAASSWPRSLPN